LYLFLIPIQGMNEQNSDSFSGEVPSTLPEASQTPSLTPKEHDGLLGILTGFLHKKSPEESTLIQEKIANLPITSEIIPSIAGGTSSELSMPAAMPQVWAESIIDRIKHIFHTHVSVPTNNAPPQVVETIAEPPVVQEVTESSADGAWSEPENLAVIDNRFAQLLKEDTTYHSMLRSEDIRHIQFQLSMRYMLLMLAIFVVIAWVVNNRVIMFSFSDIPLLSRARDALFALLTGLFALTVWFGAAVWFGDRLSIVLLRIFAVGLFIVVLVSIYLPFWR